MLEDLLLQDILKAIKENNGELIASCDVMDSVGVIDSFYPDYYFLTILMALKSLFQRFSLVKIKLII